MQIQTDNFQNNTVATGITLASWTSGKLVSTVVAFVLQGNNGAWTTIPAGEYHLDRVNGRVIKKIRDDSGTAVNWSAYTAYRATYALYDPSTYGTATYPTETQTYDVLDFVPAPFDPATGTVNTSVVLGLVVTAPQFADTIQSDNFSSGSAGWQITRAGNAEFNNVTVRGTIYAAAGAIGGFDIGTDYVRDAANSFGLASTVTGGNDVRFWAGATFANRASGTLQIYEDGFIFAKDIVLAKGSLSGASGATGYGYAVDPLFLCHYDGARPFETDFRGSAIGHKGQVDTRTGGVIFTEGLYNKSVVIAEGTTTNLVTNPSFETSATTGWTTLGTWATNAQSTTQSKFGGNSCKLVNSSGSDAFNYFVFTAAATTSTISIWLYRESGTATLTITLKENFGGFNVIATTTAATTLGGWQRIVVTGATTVSSNYRLEISSATGNTFYIDGAQAESTAYVTPYFDGSFTATYNMVGYAWTGTAHASTSTRAAATLTYPASGNINLVQGSLSFWYYANPTLPTNAYAFAVRIDANNYLRVNLASSAALKPNAGSAQGGSAVDTSSGAATATANAWHHVAVTWMAGALKLYLDGVQSGATATYAIPTGTPSTIEIGSFNSTTQANSRIDDLAILPVVLTLNEIKSIYYSSAPLMLGVSNQEIRLSGAGLGDVFGNANGLFGRAADGSASFGILNGSVNAQVWGGSTAQSETLDSGDFMFGSNASGKANINYDASAGQLKFRGGLNTRVYVDTNGDMVFSGETTPVAGYLKWKLATGELIAFLAGGHSASSSSGPQLIGRAKSSSETGLITLWSQTYDEASYGIFQVESTGIVTLDLRTGSNTAVSSQGLLVKTKTVSTNGQNTLMYLDTETSGTAAQGLSGAISFRCEDDGGTMIETGKLGFGWKNAAAASRNGVFFLSVADNGSYNEVARVNKTGQWSLGGSGITSSPSFFYEFNDGNDLQANIRADASAQNDDGWVTATIDYGEYIEKRDPAEKIGVGDIVYIKGRRATKTNNGGTAMIVSTYAGIRGGEPLHWGRKWLPVKEFRAAYGRIPKNIAAWETRFDKQVRRDEQGEPQPRNVTDIRRDGVFVLNPEWDPLQQYVSRSERTDEWIVVAFAGQVPVKVRGVVNEGDFIVPSGKGDGYGRASAYAVDNLLNAIGIAWESKADVKAGTVLCAVGIR